MAQQKHYDLATDLIHELTDTENHELQRAFQNPVIIKYFRNVGFSAVLAQSFITVEKLAESTETYKLQQAYQKGILSVADMVLNNTPKPPSS